MQTSTGKKRIGWIDALRGFTMILVVFSHVETFGFDLISESGSLNWFFQMFRMPLFFFVSGFIAYRAGEVWSSDYYKAGVLKKLRVQVIPMLFFAILYACLIFSPREETAPLESVGLLFNDPSKFGYWFTEVLLEMFLIYYTVSFLMRRRKLASRQIVLAIIAVCFFGLSLLGASTYAKHAVFNWLCIYQLLLYFQFFIFGNLVSCYRDKVFKMIENPYIIGVIILSFFGLHFVNCRIHGVTDNIVVQGLAKLITEAERYLGVITVLSLFRHYEYFFSSETKIGRGLQYIGQRTLDVYLLHYFLIPTLPALGLFFSQTNNLVLEATTGFALSLLVIVFCLIISNIIRISPFLAYWLLGVKRAKE